MKHKFAALAIVAFSLLFIWPLTAQAQDQDAGQPVQQEEPTPRELVERKTAEWADQAAEKGKDFMEYADGYFEQAAESRVLGWSIMGGAALIGVLSLFFGWTLVQSLLVPSAPVIGLATGGFTAFCIVEALYTGRPVWFRLSLLAVGAGMGIALYLFSALRAKPVAAFLVVLSPFLILAAFLFSFNEIVGLVLVCAGFLAGFAAMIEVRPLSIVATSMLGASAFVGIWGLLSHLIAGDESFVQHSFQWLIENPLMLCIGWLALVFIGTSFQFAAGPRGSLED